MADRLTRSRRETLDHFKAITQVKNDEQAIEVLTKAKWDLTRALDDYQLPENSDVEMKTASSSSSCCSVSSSMETSSKASGTITISSTTEGSAVTMISALTASSEPPKANFQDPLINNNEMSMELATRRFADRFQARYGSGTPKFFIGSLGDAVKEAFEAPGKRIMDRRPLAVYLHNDQAVGANIFAGGVMCSSVSALLSTNFLLWGWDVTLETNKEKLFDAMRDLHMNPVVSNVNRLQTDDYPVLVVLQRHNGVISIANKSLGGASVQNVVQKLNLSLARFTEQNLAEAHLDRERKERERVRREQADEYEKSLAADRAKAQKAQEERERMELEKQQMEEATALAQRQAEDRGRRRAEILASLPVEPAESEPNIVIVRVRLPGGAPKLRRFRLTDQLKALLDFVESQGFFMDEYRVWNSDRPKKDLTNMDQAKTFAELRWPKRELVLVDEK